MTLEGAIKRIIDERKRDLTNSNHDILSHMIIGLCEEAGEVAGLLKRYYRGDGLPKVKLMEEFGDVLWYLVNAADLMGLSLEEILEYNRLKLEGRYNRG